MANEKKALLSELDDLIKIVESGGTLPKGAAKIISDIEDKVNSIAAKEKKEPMERMFSRLGELGDAIKRAETTSSANTKDTIRAIGKVKVRVEAPQVKVSPPKVEVNVPPTKPPVVNVPKTQVIVPKTVTVRKPSWLPSLKPINDTLSGIKESISKIKFPTKASNPISVRLSDGEKFYRALAGAAHGGAIAAFKNAAGVVKQALVDGDNVVVTNQGNKISTTLFNSRDAATLAAGATFQGVGEDVSKYGRAGIAIHSTNAADGVLTVEVSHDNLTFFGPTRDWANTNIAVPHMWNIVEKYFRIKYVNGTTEATDLSIQVQYSNNADIILSHQLNKTLAAETEATVVRPTNDFDLDSARKHITGQRAFFFFGHNNALQSNVFEDVWEGGGDINWQTTAAKIKIKSTHAADTATGPGLGLQSVEIHGLDANGADIEEVLALSGVTPVESVNSYIRVNLVHNEEVGTYGGSHQGTIEWRVTNATFGNGALLGQMSGLEGAADSSVQFGYGEAQNGFTSVPLGKVLYVTRLEVIPKANKGINVILYERDGLLTVADPFQPRRVIWSAEELEEPVEKEFKSHIKIKALADLFFRAEGVGAVSGVDVELDYYLVDADSDGA